MSMRSLLALLLVLSLCSPVHAAARPRRAADVHTTIASHGLALTLGLPVHAYPEGALVRYSVSVKNTSRHTLWLCCMGPPMPGNTPVHVGTFDSSGRPLKGPTLDVLVPLPGPAPGCMPLAPGATWRARDYVILAGPVVRASVALRPAATGVPCFNDRTAWIRTKPITVSLGPPDTPRAMLDNQGGEMRAVLEPPVAVTGNPVYMSSCADDHFTKDPNSYVQQLSWTHADGPAIPGCYQPLEWHALAAWPGHSVVEIDYIRGKTRREDQSPAPGMDPYAIYLQTRA